MVNQMNHDINCGLAYLSSNENFPTHWEIFGIGRVCISLPGDKKFPVIVGRCGFCYPCISYLLKSYSLSYLKNEKFIPFTFSGGWGRIWPLEIVRREDTNGVFLKKIAVVIAHEVPWLKCNVMAFLFNGDLFISVQSSQGIRFLQQPGRKDFQIWYVFRPFWLRKRDIDTFPGSQNLQILWLEQSMGR